MCASGVRVSGLRVDGCLSGCWIQLKSLTTATHINTLMARTIDTKHTYHLDNVHVVSLTT